MSLIDQGTLVPGWTQRHPAPARSRLALPPTEILLAQGGDARIAIDARSGRNKYGCGPRPEPMVADFGSSTASCVSDAAFAAADMLRQRLCHALRDDAPHTIYAHEVERIRDEFLYLSGLDDMAGLAMILGASGTDLHLFAAQLCAGGVPSSLTIIAVDAKETGSGVPAALGGRHFGSRTALGKAVAQNDALQGSSIDMIDIANRMADGGPRPSGEIDAEVEAVARRALAAGRHVLLVLVDVSKTGLIAPSPDCASRLLGLAPERIDLLVDACQFRLAPATLRAYLAAGFMVAVTGSKFLTGPAFSGALLLPERAALGFSARPTPPGLRLYTAAAEWPRGWRAAAGLDRRANFGLLLRWEAALQELRAFAAIPPATTRRVLAEFARVVEQRLATDPAFEPLATPPIMRGAFGDRESWDRVRTIFPFLLRRVCGTGPGSYLDPPETARTYELLRRDAAKSLGPPCARFDGRVAQSHFRLGQPVRCGDRSGRPVTALRLNASARLVVEAASSPSGVLDVTRRAMAALDKASLLVRGIT